MENTVYDVVLNKITNSNLKAIQKEKLIKLGINIDDIIAENKLTIPEQIDENNL